MSSHHIVREKQEPALYIHCLGNFDEEYLGQLLEWSPSLIVNSSEFEKVISLGLKVDMVVNPEPSHIFQENTKFISTEDSDRNTVLQYLIAEQYPAVNLIDAEGGLEDLEQFIPQINIVVFTETQKTYAIKSGFKVWKPSGALFQIYSTDHFNHSNLNPEAENKFRVINDGFVEFNFEAPFLFLSETL